MTIFTTVSHLKKKILNNFIIRLNEETPPKKADSIYRYFAKKKLANTKSQLFFLIQKNEYTSNFEILFRLTKCISQLS